MRAALLLHCLLCDIYEELSAGTGNVSKSLECWGIIVEAHSVEK